MRERVSECGRERESVGGRNQEGERERRHERGEIVRK